MCSLQHAGLWRSVCVEYTGGGHTSASVNRSPMVVNSSRRLCVCVCVCKIQNINTQQPACSISTRYYSAVYAHGETTLVLLTDPRESYPFLLHRNRRRHFVSHPLGQCLHSEGQPGHIVIAHHKW